MFKVAVSSSAAMLLSQRIGGPVLAVFALLPVLAGAAFLLAIGFIIRSLWYLLKPNGGLSIERAWRYFQWGVLGASAVAWAIVTMIMVQAPVGPSNETVAIANLRTINTAEVTYRYDHGGKYGDLPDLIA